MLIAALGLEYEVRGLASGDAKLLEQLWSHCLAVHPQPTGALRVAVRQSSLGWVATLGDERWDLPGSDAAVAAVCTAVNVSATARTSLLALHAAVLTRAGSTLVVPGRSGLGKTTLTLALLADGWAYVTDEAFALDWAPGAPCPYPRPMGVSDWTRGTLALAGGVRYRDETFIGPDGLGEVDTTPGPATRVLLLSRRTAPGGAPVLHDAHPMDALEELMHRGFTVHRDPAAALRVLADVVRSCSVLRLDYDDPVAAAAAITAAC